MEENVWGACTLPLWIYGNLRAGGREKEKTEPDTSIVIAREMRGQCNLMAWTLREGVFL